MRMRASIQMKKQLQELGRTFGSFPFCGEVCGGVGGKLRQFTQIGESRWMTLTTQQHMPQRSGNPNPNARMGFWRAFSSLEVQHDAIGKFDLRSFAPLPGGHEQQISSRSIFAVCRYKVSEGLRTHASKATAWEAEPEFTADWEAPQSQDNSSQGNQKLVMMGEGDPVDWNQKNIRLREFDARQRTAAGVPAPKVQPDDVYIPVKAFYVSRRSVMYCFFTFPFCSSNPVLLFSETTCPSFGWSEYNWEVWADGAGHDLRGAQYRFEEAIRGTIFGNHKLSQQSYHPLSQPSHGCTSHH